MNNPKHNMNHGQVRRFYCPSLAGELIALDSTEAHHLINVVRVKPGQSVELFDGKDNTAEGTVEKAKRSEAIIRISSHQQHNPPQGVNIHLQFAVPKSKRLDWLIEKACELGAASLQAVIFERSVAGPKTKKDLNQDKWMNHCIAAAKQSGLNFMPQIRPPAELAEVIESETSTGLKIVGDLCENTVSLKQAIDAEHHCDICILVGPEGGLTQAERALTQQARYIPVKLGETILRIETAAIALAAGVRAVSE